MTTPPSGHDDERVPPTLVTPDQAAAEPQAAHADAAALPRIPAAGPARARIDLGSPALQGLLALAVYLAVWLAAGALPLVIHPGWAQLGQAGPDPNFYVWALRWWPYAIAHGLNPLYSAQVEAPAGASLVWITTVPPLALLVSPVTLAVGPVVSFNLLVAVCLPVSGWAAFALCRRITGRFWPALAGGAVYGFSGYEANHIGAGQLNLAFSPFLPLMAYLVVLWWDEKIGTRKLVGLLALVMAAQFYLFLETFADMTVVLAVALLAGYALAGRSGRPAVARLIRLVSLAYLLAMAVAAPYLWFALGHVPPGTRSSARTSLDPMSLVISGYGKAFKLSWLYPHRALRPPVEIGSYVGIPLLAIAAAMAVLTWSRKITRFLTVMLLFVIVAALGPVVRVNGHRLHGLLWKRLWYLPIVRDAFPARLMVFAFLALAVIMAIWLTGPSKRLWLRWLLALLAMSAVVANVPPLNLRSGPGVPSFITTGEYRHYLAPGATVVVVPANTGNAGLLWQAETGFYFRLAGGYLNHAVAHNVAVPLPVADLVRGTQTPRDIRRFRSFVRTAGVSAILVEAGSSRSWQIIFARLGLKHQSIGGVTLYRTT